MLYFIFIFFLVLQVTTNLFICMINHIIILLYNTYDLLLGLENVFNIIIVITILNLNGTCYKWYYNYNIFLPWSYEVFIDILSTSVNMIKKKM